MKNIMHKLFILLSAFIIIIAGSSLAYAMQKGTKKLPITQFYSPKHTNAVWDWSNPLNRKDSVITDTAVLLKSHQINTVYTDVSIYESISEKSDRAQRNLQIEQLQKLLSNYIKIMNNNGIAVIASAGDSAWSKPSEQHIAVSLLKFVQDYNGTHSNKFNGMEFDIEAYNQKGFPEASMTEKSLVLMEYLDTVDALAGTTEKYIASSNDKKFELGFSIPYWFDNENKNIESLSWHDKTGPALFHIMDRLNKLPQSNVVVMAYRNAAQGNDGIIFHSRTEIEYAQSQARKVRVIIGIETTNVEPKKITFFGKTQTELSSETTLLTEAFNNSGVLGGIAINDLPGYTAVINNK